MEKKTAGDVVHGSSCAPYLKDRDILRSLLPTTKEASSTKNDPVQVYEHEHSKPRHGWPGLPSFLRTPHSHPSLTQGLYTPVFKQICVPTSRLEETTTCCCYSGPCEPPLFFPLLLYTQLHSNSSCLIQTTRSNLIHL